jgi:hypothetical protein
VLKHGSEVLLNNLFAIKRGEMGHTHHLGMNYYVNFLGSNEFQLIKGLAPMAIEKIKILGAILELPAKQHCETSPFT